MPTNAGIPTRRSLRTLQPTSHLPRPFHLLLFLLGALWVAASSGLALRAAEGITVRFNLSLCDQLLQQTFFLFLLLWGFAAIRWLTSRTPSSGILSTSYLPSRPTSRQEGLRGAALGWGMLLAAILPMMLHGSLHPEFNLSPANGGIALLSLATIAISSLAVEVAFRGFLFANLIDATGPVFATLFLSFACATLASFRPNASLLSIVIAFFFSVLYSIAYLQTRALWVGWGIHFAWNAAATILFGLPLASDASYNNLLFTSVTGPDWLTGGPYGPEAALFTLLVILAAIAILYRITRAYAWEYTYAPPAPAGYPMDVAPPSAHTAMEAAAAATPAPLVQILTTTPTAPSTNPTIEQHLTRDPNTREE
jgi:membrane protease YdiL (CAAX protease family)